jgi:uncharacterized membrane protein
MEMMPVIILVVLGIPIALAGWLIARSVSVRDRLEEFSRRLAELELELSRLKKEKESAKPVAPAPAPQPEIFTPAPVAPPQPIVTAPPPVSSLQHPPVATPPPVFVAPIRSTPTPPAKTKPPINWEQFMGVKMFAYVGGLAAFIGVALAVKYSFDHNLVSPEVRMTAGFLTGIFLLVAGTIIHRRQQYAVGAQTLCATGVVILYAVTFACHSIYKFPFFAPVQTFLVMIFVTAVAFTLAVRLNALVVAVLGMLGGFLTPMLISTGEDNPLGLFGYIAILDAGLIFVALHRRWYFLTALAALGTAWMQIGWAGDFFTVGKYFEGDKIFVALGVLFGFNVLFLGAALGAKSCQRSNRWFTGALLGLAAVAILFTGWFLTFASLAQQPWLMFGFVFLIDLVVAALAWLDDEAANAQPVAGLGVFGLLLFWTEQSLDSGMLKAALAFYFIFAVFHSVFPVVLQRQRSLAAPLWGSRMFPALSLALVLFPIFQLADISLVVWPFVLLVDVLAFVMALATLSLWPVLIVLGLTLAALGEFIWKIPADLTGLPDSLLLLGTFSIIFVAVGIWLAHKFSPKIFAPGSRFGGGFSAPADVAAQLPAFAVVLPFLLLIMATLRLPLENPSPIFGLALLLVGLLFGVAKLFSLDGLPAVGLICVAALESAWHFNHFNPATATVPLGWYLGFFTAFALFPFLFLKHFSGKVVPWAAAALAGLPQFFLIHRLVKAAYPNDIMGLLAAAFAIPPMVSLAIVLKKIPVENRARLAQLAWFGGVALFFITLICPVQFKHQWITLGWALEGAALLWLFHRVPHPGLPVTGVGLLVVAFVRLAFNPAVLAYHQRSAAPIFNWYLYTYGIVTVCLFVGAKFLAPPRNLVLNSNTPPILAALGTVLAFLLLNIEIADYFSEPGSTLTFQFNGNFARDMSYSIAWALFALVLLVVGIMRKIPATRYAAMGLLCVTILKLFFHDLARLNQLYRIGAFIGVAVIAMLASFAYQKFFAASLAEDESNGKPPP